MGNSILSPTWGIDEPPWLANSDLDVRWLGTPWQRLVGGMFDAFPDYDELIVFAWPRVGWRPIHMLGVRDRLRVLWLRGEESREVVADRVLEPGLNYHIDRAHTIVECRPETSLPSGLLDADWPPVDDGGVSRA